jgi:hypothetical protein
MMKISQQQHMIAVAIMADERVPRDAIGYAQDIQSPTITIEVMKDRLTQLSKYVPDLVERYREATIDALAAELEEKGSKLDSCFGSNKKSMYRAAAANKLEAAVVLGRKGGAAKTEAKTAASRANGKKGGRPRKNNA